MVRLTYDFGAVLGAALIENSINLDVKYVTLLAITILLRLVGEWGMHAIRRKFGRNGK